MKKVVVVVIECGGKYLSHELFDSRHEYVSPGLVSSYMRIRVAGDGLSEKVRPLVQEWLDKQHEPG